MEGRKLTSKSCSPRAGVRPLRASKRPSGPATVSQRPPTSTQVQHNQPGVSSIVSFLAYGRLGTPDAPGREHLGLLAGRFRLVLGRLAHVHRIWTELSLDEHEETCVDDLEFKTWGMREVERPAHLRCWRCRGSSLGEIYPGSGPNQFACKRCSYIRHFWSPCSRDTSPCRTSKGS